jgi:SAM-dependent methyltransferase
MPFPRLGLRNRQPEIMDQPNLDAGLHFRALRGLERINSLSGSAGILWTGLSARLAEFGGREIRLLDVATGAGDLPIRLWHKAQRAGVPVKIDACDVSPAALTFARERARRVNAPVQFFECDALAGPLPAGYDVLTSSLFLHHLDEATALVFLRRLAEAAERLVLVNDLVRGLRGFVLAYVGARLLTTSPVVHVDAPRSVEAAFTIEEARDLARRAGLQGAVVTRRWPCRYLLSWSRL